MEGSTVIFRKTVGEPNFVDLDINPLSVGLPNMDDQVQHMKIIQKYRDAISLRRRLRAQVSSNICR